MKLPESWGSVTVEQWYKIRAVKHDDPLENTIELLAAVSGQSVESIEALSLDELNRALHSIAFLNELPSGKIPKYCLVGKTVYLINTDATKLNANQYIDLTTLTKDRESIDTNLHKIMAVFCLPLKRWSFSNTVKYADHDFNKRAEAFLQMPMSKVYPVALFFCTLLDNFMPPIRDYLKDQQTKIQRLVS